MKSYTGLRNLYGKLTRNTTSDNLTFGDELMNDEYKHILEIKDFDWKRRLRTLTTQAGTTFLTLPYDVDEIESVYVTVGSTRYVPVPAPSRKYWDELHFSTQTSDFPTYWFSYNGQLGLWPRPGTSGNVVTMNAKIKVSDLNIADITSSTITTLTNGSTNIVVSGGLTAQMTGFWIRPTFATATNTGDGQWYEISSVTSATQATLVRSYGGNSIAAGTAACTISQMPLIPEPFQDMLVYKAASIYWAREGDDGRAAQYQSKYDRDMKSLLGKTSEISDVVIDDGEERPLLNQNLTISL